MIIASLLGGRTSMIVASMLRRGNMIMASMLDCVMCIKQVDPVYNVK